jgi:hypothetical protein
MVKAGMLFRLCFGRAGKRIPKVGMLWRLPPAATILADTAAVTEEARPPALAEALDTAALVAVGMLAILLPDK